MAFGSTDVLEKLNVLKVGRRKSGLEQTLERRRSLLEIESGLENLEEMLKKVEEEKKECKARGDKISFENLCVQDIIIRSQIQKFKEIVDTGKEIRRDTEFGEKVSMITRNIHESLRKIVEGAKDRKPLDVRFLETPPIAEKAKRVGADIKREKAALLIELNKDSTQKSNLSEVVLPKYVRDIIDQEWETTEP